MPMLKRPIAPSSITRSSDGQIPSAIKNELEYVANSTQANLIRQLSSLSKHAEDMFRELFEEATTIYQRTCQLTTKVETLKDSVQQFDPNQVIVKLTDVTKRKPYKTDYHTDQQICTKSTMPLSLLAMYDQCAPPPRLDKFDKFKTDGKPSIKLYTNPDYFVQLWVESIQKNVSETTKKHDGKRVKRKPSRKGGKNLADVKDRSKKFDHLAHGKEFIPAKVKEDTTAQQKQSQPPNNRQQNQDHSNPPVSNGHDHPGYGGQSQNVRQSQQGVAPDGYQHPPPAPPVHVAQGNTSHLKYQEMIYDTYKPDAGSSGPAYSSQIPPPNMVQSLSDSSQLSRVSVASSSPSMSRIGMPPPPPPPVETSSHSLPPPPSPPGPSDVGIVPPPPPPMDHISSIRAASPPPPMEPNPMFIAPTVPPPPPPISYSHTAVAAPPPPPPPPPPDPMSLPPPPAPPQAGTAAPSGGQGPNAALLSQAAAGLRSTRDMPRREPIKDERSGLLDQIRIGIQLRGAEERKQNESNTGTLDSKKVMLGGTFDVQSIMDKVQEMRRVMENSDSESGSESWDDDDDD